MLVGAANSSFYAFRVAFLRHGFCKFAQNSVDYGFGASTASEVDIFGGTARSLKLDVLRVPGSKVFLN